MYAGKDIQEGIELYESSLDLRTEYEDQDTKGSEAGAFGGSMDWMLKFKDGTVIHVREGQRYSFGKDQSNDYSIDDPS